MTAQPGNIAGDRSAPWVLEHPGVAALVAAFSALVGLAVLLAALAGVLGTGQPDMLGQLWNGILVLAGALMFLAGLPASLGFCGASCATERELWAGVLGGLIGVVVTLGLVGIMLPAHGLAL